MSHSLSIITDPCLCDVYEHLSPKALYELFDVDKGHNPGKTENKTLLLDSYIKYHTILATL